MSRLDRLRRAAVLGLEGGHFLSDGGEVGLRIVRFERQDGQRVLGLLLALLPECFFFGVPLERYLGTERFVILYALGLALSPVISLIRHRDNPAYATLGASGAVSAVLFAYVCYNPTSRMIIFPIPIPIQAWVFAIGYLAYSIWASRQNKGRINHDAHLAGALTGLAFVAVTDPRAISRLMQMFGM